MIGGFRPDLDYIISRAKVFVLLGPVSTLSATKFIDRLSFAVEQKVNQLEFDHIISYRIGVQVFEICNCQFVLFGMRYSVTF